MKNRKLHTLCLLFMLVLAAACLVGCNAILGNESKSPIEIIQDNFGDKQYTISFSSAGLDTPLADLTYSANEIPELPTPKRVGYAFAGWYMDEARTKRFDKDLLYLQMKDVTLYASWVAEEFAINGIYDINYEAHIMPETVVLGSKTEEYGGYYDFTESLIPEEIYLEKTDDNLLLRIQYDCHTTVPFMSEQSLYSVAVNPRTGTSVYICESVASEVETVKTVFVKVSDFDMSQPIYLDIVFMNWMTAGLTTEERLKTITKYTVEFNITEFIGFSRSYENPDLPLENGWYQVKTHYLQETGDPTMIETFNPVYSYIYAEDGNYKLVKPFTPYAGLLGISGEAASLYDYYHRLMTFAQPLAFYRFDENAVPEERISSDYFPATYGGKYFGNLSVEFHADTGELYYIFDLGDDYRSPLMVFMAVTGFMEIASAMGSMNMIMTIDFDHILKVNNFQYEFLEGDAYSYSREELYYPGNADDLDNNNLSKDIIEGYGISNNFINLYFSTSDFNEDMVYNRHMYSFSYSVTPKAGVNSATVADSRNRAVVFDVNTNIYGYTPDSYNRLYADSMTTTTLGGLGLRENFAVRQGKSFDKGDTVNLANIYSELSDSGNLDLSGVTWKTYAMIDGKVDFSSPVANVPVQFSFSEPLGVLFTKRAENGSAFTTLIELTRRETPSVSFVNTEENTHRLELTEQTSRYSVYTSQDDFRNGQQVYFPILNYEWMGKEGGFIDVYYPSGDSAEDKYGINPVHAAIFTVADGIWECGSVQANNLVFTLSVQDKCVVYELTNDYGEAYYVYVLFPGVEQKNARFEVTVDGKPFRDGFIGYNQDGEPVVKAQYSSNYFLTKDNIADLLVARSYVLKYLTYRLDYVLSSYTVYTRENTATYAVADADRDTVIERIKDIVAATEGYCLVRLDYLCGTNYVREYYVANVNISGNTTENIFKFENYFSGTEYTVVKPALYSNGVRLSLGSISINAYIGEQAVTDNQNWFTLNDDGMQYRITFKKAGTFVVTLRFWLGSDEFGESVNSDESAFSITYAQQIEVLDGQGSVFITYVTDNEHPFKGGLTEITREYTLSQVINTLKADAFEYSGNDICFAWSAAQGKSTGYYPGKAISSFVTTFNAQHIRLYAYWDKGITVTVDSASELTGIGEKQIVLYRRTIAPYEGYYQLNLAAFTVPENKIPVGYVFKGWTSDIFGGEIYAADKTVNINDSQVQNGGTYEVRAVFVRLMKVSYDLTAKHPETGETFCPSQFFFPVEYIAQGDTVTNTEIKNNLGCNVEGYEFKGWYVKGDETKTLVDIATYEIERDTVFVAFYDVV